MAKPIVITQEFDSSHPSDRVRDAVNNPERYAGCIPGFAGFDFADESALVFRVQISPEILQELTGAPLASYADNAVVKKALNNPVARFATSGAAGKLLTENPLAKLAEKTPIGKYALNHPISKATTIPLDELANIRCQVTRIRHDDDNHVRSLLVVENVLTTFPGNLSLKIIPKGSGCKLDYRATLTPDDEIDIFGRTFMKSAADSLISAFFKNIEESLASQ